MTKVDILKKNPALYFFLALEELLLKIIPYT